MSSDPFVTDSEAFTLTLKRTANVFCSNRRLPEQVFANGFNDFSFMEFDVLLFREFWDVLTGCAQACGDDELSVVVHEPDPAAYYFANFERYGALRFDRKTTAAEYKKAFLIEPAGSPVDALQYVAGVISWCGNSGQWGFWGERDLGVAVAAKRNRSMSWPKVSGVSWFELDKAVASFVAPNFEAAVPQQFVAELRRNFKDASSK